MDELFKRSAKIHIWFHRQSRHRATTTIEALDDDLDLERICRYMRRSFSCNGCVLDENKIQLQGDQRDAVRTWLVQEEVLTEKEAKERIVVHGQ
jgi:translation initiation factor SUI1